MHRVWSQVPECVSLLLDGFLPRAQRDTSAEFRAALAADAPTQSVLAEYREKLHDWLRTVTRRDAQVADGGPPPQRITYALWVALMDGPSAEQRKPGGPRPACPKMVGEWSVRQESPPSHAFPRLPSPSHTFYRVRQESQVTGDERTMRRVQLEIRAKLSIPQVRWNFLRSQAIEQMVAGEADEAGEGATLDFHEMLEAVARCAVHMYAPCMELWVPSHGRHLFRMADAVRAFVQNLLFEKSPQMCMWEASLIRASRFDWRGAERLPSMAESEFKLFQVSYS